jgi:acyl CoA:acetate/3-ketoacid CoA transferase alpha subunit/acyl CoA:acetate/3-ketoacid CoA transferase beta subunit
MRRIVTLAEAAAEVPDGALLTLGGFQMNRSPMALVCELIRLKRRGLRIVALPDLLPLDLLVGAGAIAEAEFGFLGLQSDDGFVVAPATRRAIERGTIGWRERDVYEIIQSLRAAAFGLPFLPAPGGEGSDYRKVNRTPTVRDAGGEETLVAHALPPEVALIHAQEADQEGNLSVSDPYAEDLLARASGRVVATVERLVKAIDRPTIPGRFVEKVAVVPGGAFPASCHRFYPHSGPHLKDYVRCASEDRVAEYLGRFVTGVADHTAFLHAAGGPGSWGAPSRPGGLHPESVAGPEAREGHRAADRVVVGMARLIDDGEVVATGVASALPMLAVALARATRAPGLTYINCVGAVNPEVATASASSVDVSLLDRCQGRITLPEMFDLARRGGIDVMFFGATQVDREGRMNLTCIGDYARPRVKLPGPAGSSSMRPFVPKVVIILPRHTPRSLVERVDFATAVASPRNRETLVLTDRALLRLDGGRLRTVSRHAGTSMADLRARTGFSLEAGEAPETPDPTAAEMEALRRLDAGGIRHRLI